MINRKSFILLASMLFSFIGTAQQIKKLTFGKIPVEDLAMTVYSPDSSAEAVVLDDILDVYFVVKTQFEFFLDRHRRIKILTEAGISQGTVMIPFYSKDRSENISKIKAVITQPDGTSIKVEKENIFEEERNEYYSVKKIAFPEVKVGSIIEYSYTLESKQIIYPDDLYFQGEIPVRYVQMEFLAPKELDYSIITTGNEVIKPQGKVYVASTLPAIRKEPYMTRKEDYYTKITLQLQSYINNAGFREPVLSSWDIIAKDMNLSESFGVRMNSNNQTSNAWKEISASVEALPGKMEKAKFIYDFVVGKVKWDDKYRLYSKKKGDDVLEDKLGSSADINATIINLMRKADLEAYPLITNPRSLGWFNPTFPILNNINNILGCVIIDGKKTIFNGASTHSPFGFLNTNDYNRNGVLLKKETGEVIEIVTQNLVSTHKFDLKMGVDGKITGTVSSRYSQVSINDEYAAHLAGELEKNWASRLSHIPELKITDFTGSLGEKGFESSFAVEYGEETEDADIVYFPTDLYSLFSKNPFKSEKRTFPVDFGNGYSETILIMLEIPEGYVLESLPQNLNISTAGKQISYMMNSTNLGNKVSITRRTNVHNSYILPADYLSIKNIFSQIESKNSDILVLKKAE